MAVIALSFTVCVSNKGVQEHCTRYQALRNITGQHCPCGHLVIDSSSLRVAIHPIPYPQSASSVKCVSLQFRGKNVMLDTVKCFAQVQGDDTSCSSLIHQHCNPIIGHQIYQAPFAHKKAMLAVTNHHLIFSLLQHRTLRICSMILPGINVKLTGL